ADVTREKSKTPMSLGVVWESRKSIESFSGVLRKSLRSPGSLSEVSRVSRESRKPLRSFSGVLGASREFREPLESFSEVPGASRESREPQNLLFPSCVESRKTTIFWFRSSDVTLTLKSKLK